MSDDKIQSLWKEIDSSECMYGIAESKKYDSSDSTTGPHNNQIDSKMLTVDGAIGLDRPRNIESQEDNGPPTTTECTAPSDTTENSEQPANSNEYQLACFRGQQCLTTGPLNHCEYNAGMKQPFSDQPYNDTLGLNLENIAASKSVGEEKCLDKAERRNAKERRRYKNISSNIEKIRILLDRDGWKVDASTKSRILESCCFYIHSIKKRIKVKEDENSKLSKKLLAHNKDLETTIESSAIVGMEPFKWEYSLDSDIGNYDDMDFPDSPNKQLNGKNISTSPKSLNSDQDFLEISPYKWTANFSAYDYKSIFLSSHFPQLVAKPSGQIRVCNASFLCFSNFTVDETLKRTIFSLVKFQNLPKLYKYIAELLDHLKTLPNKGNNSKISSETSRLDKHDCFITPSRCEQSSIKITPILDQNRLISYHCGFTTNS